MDIFKLFQLLFTTFLSANTWSPLKSSLQRYKSCMYNNSLDCIGYTNQNIEIVSNTLKMPNTRVFIFKYQDYYLGMTESPILLSYMADNLHTFNINIDQYTHLVYYEPQ